jgi:hypothetical protein
MAQQWQLRRGNTAQNNAFTGAAGEVTVDTTTHALRVHDGSTAGGFTIDTVVAYQTPDPNNDYKWYRKYASGWVEQGGTKPTTSTYSTITLPIAMRDANYQVLTTVNVSSSTNYSSMVRNKTTTSFQTFQDYVVDWEVKGMAA